MNIHSVLEQIAHKLPAQGPIKDFIHHNTLHAFQHLNFHEALKQASEFYNAQSYMPPEFYTGKSSESPVSHFKKEKLRRRIPELLGEDWDLSIQPILVRLISGFLDQGIALSPFPESNYTFFEALEQLCRNAWVPIAYFTNKKRTRAYFRKSPEQVCEEILNQLVGQEIHFEQYITETLMTQRGWSGMIHAIEQHPDSLLLKREIKLIEFLALKLILEWEFILFSGADFVPIGNQQVVLPSAPRNDNLIKLHEQFENKYYHEVLSKFKDLTHTAKIKRNIQAVFCIDDRECSFRRHLEQTDPQVETFATAGFFGIDFFFQSLNDASPKKLCPAPIQPRHLIFEKPHPLHRIEFENQKKQRIRKATWLKRLSFMGIVLPRKIQIPTELTLYREEDKSNKETKLYHGFSYEEMAARVFYVLNNMGLTHDFSPIIAIIAHGSSSLNNPHFAAYDCGACSGNPGAPNSRVFASMANLKPVRELLKKQGLQIPESTRFLAGFHDTCTDSVDFFDTENLSTKHLILFSHFLKTLEITKRANAKERCQKFAVVKSNISPREALVEVQRRATVLFEPRPELGHANNALCIVGRRDLTQHLFFDRRAFFNSYDYAQDPDGKILNQILSTVVPVCGGINLEYYFSRVDNAVYGCGTKLSHNVCALLGVYNGIDDDLRTGLPIQMVELHDPIRLLTIVEQTPEITERILQNNQAVYEWIQNEWIKLACITPKSHRISFFKPHQGFVEYPL